MKTQIKMLLTNERLLEILSEEISKTGKFVYSNKRKTVEEMLKMRGVKF